MTKLNVPPARAASPTPAVAASKIAATAQPIATFFMNAIFMGAILLCKKPIRVSLSSRIAGGLAGYYADAFAADRV
jgi:hypothetical protein